MEQRGIPLVGGTHGPVVRLGDTVRREPRASTRAVHALLRHIEHRGFDGAPRALGFDERGREVLSYIPGDVVGHRGLRVPPAYLRDLDTLLHLARLLRRFHDATVGFVAPVEASWAFQVGAPRDGEVICHNDIGPWNVVFAHGRPVAIIDFDTAAPAPREWDVAYALYRFVPFVPDEVCAMIGWPHPPDRRSRMTALCEEYGLERPGGILEVMIRRIESMLATGIATHEAGDPVYGKNWFRVIMPRLLRDVDFIRCFNAPTT